LMEYVMLRLDSTNTRTVIQ